MFRVLFLLLKSPLKANNSGFKITLMFLVLLWYSSAGYLYFELPSRPDLGWTDSIWWTLVTMTTVGYGDYFPETILGRFIIGIPTMVFGIGFLGFIISNIAAKLIETQTRRIKGMLKINDKNHVIIVNYNSLEKIQSLINELRNDSLTKDKAICLIDEKLEELPNELIKTDIKFVKGDATDENILLQANIENATHAIILSKDSSESHSDDINLSITLVIEKLHPKINSIVEAINPKKVRQIKLAGADSVVCVSELTSNLIIQELQDPGVKDIIDQLTSNNYGQQFYITPIKNSNNKKYIDLINWSIQNNCSVVGLIRNNNPIINCNKDENLKNDDSAIIVAEKRFNNIEFK